MVKVIVTGSTGTVGSAVLQACLHNPAVTSVVALTRRPVDVQHSKLNNVIQTDFLTYEQSVLDQLNGASACIWALGSPTSGNEVHVDYTWAAINTFSKHIVPQLADGQKFRFVYTSGGAVPYLESNALFFLGEWRKSRAKLDREILELNTKSPKTWESFVVRPWFVVDEVPTIGRVLSNSYVFRPELGAAMVDLAVNGGHEHVVNNGELRSKGQAVLGREEKL